MKKKQKKKLIKRLEVRKEYRFNASQLFVMLSDAIAMYDDSLDRITDHDASDEAAVMMIDRLGAEAENVRAGRCKPVMQLVGL